MKRFLIRLTLVLLCVAGLSGLGYWALPPSEEGSRAVQRLRQASVFSFGPVDVTGETGESEEDFTIILRSRHASALFQQLFNQGSAPARLYALCGLWHTHAGFNSFAERFTREHKTVETLSACIGKEIPTSELVAQIREGMLDQYLEQLETGVELKARN